MKNLIIAILFVLSTAIPAFAKDFKIPACTADRHIAVLTIDVTDDIPDNISADIKAAFIKTAKQLSADILVSEVGYQQFVSNLAEADFEYINGLTGPPVIGADCEEI